MAKTFMQRKEDVKREWFLVDARGKVLGRLAARLAHLLQGKHKPTYTPHIDGGDFVVVVNAKELVLTGKKRSQKMYKRWSGYPGGLRYTPAEKVLARRPEKALRLAVQRMLPKSKLGRKMLKKLKIYPGPEHPHTAQAPRVLEI